MRALSAPDLQLLVGVRIQNSDPRPPIEMRRVLFAHETCAKLYGGASVVINWRGGGLSWFQLFVDFRQHAKAARVYEFLPRLVATELLLDLLQQAERQAIDIT